MVVYIKPIPDMISDYELFLSERNLKKNDVAIIVITRYHYEYNFTPILELDFDDIDEDYKPLNGVEINDSHVEELRRALPEIKKSKVVFYCCDAGISRSPAVATAVAHYLGDYENYAELKWRYPYMNNLVFRKILLGLNRGKERLFESEYNGLKSD